MPKSAFEPCIPTRGTKVPDRPEWIHEIKHDGYRLIVQRDGKSVRLWTRNGHDWSGRFPLITEAGPAQPLQLIRPRRRGRAARRRRHFEDLRRPPLSMRKANLTRLLARRVDGIFLSDFEQGEIGPDLFRHACLMGLESLVSKHRMVCTGEGVRRAGSR